MEGYTCSLTAVGVLQVCCRYRRVDFAFLKRASNVSWTESGLAVISLYPFTRDHMVEVLFNLACAKEGEVGNDIKIVDEFERARAASKVPGFTRHDAASASHSC
jgi:hypothetical protein